LLSEIAFGAFLVYSITRGATMLAAVSRVMEAFPRAEVRAFALIRTLSDQEVERIVAPCTGTVRLHGPNSIRREP
jgi:hypothetical protein